MLSLTCLVFTFPPTEKYLNCVGTPTVSLVCCYKGSEETSGSVFLIGEV